MKKILAFALIFLQLFSVSAFALSLTDGQKQDLYHLGIMVGDEAGDLRLGDTITRAEAVKMLCVAADYAEGLSEASPFPDVPRGHWAEGYIQTAKEKEIVVGDEKGCFNPESPVTNEEIVKMIVCLLGYSPMAEPFGGFPAGYTRAAGQIGLTENLGLEVNAPAVRENVAIMIARALDIPLMTEKEGDGGDGADYVILNGENGLPLATLRGARSK